MYTKLTAIMLVAALTAVLITSATIALSDDADARKNRNRNSNSQSLSQSNGGGCEQCSNVGVQQQGKGNSVAISVNQND
jgi:hypothetical protein